MTSPILSNFAPVVTFLENAVNAAPQRLFGDVTLTANGFAGGVLRMTGLLADDQVSVIDGGTGAGVIGLSEASVTYGGAVIGTLSGGVGAALRIDFAAAATAAAIEALIESLTFQTLSDTPVPSRNLRLTLTDAAGDALSPAVYTALSGADNPLSAVPAIDGSAAAFFDADGDGHLDALVGSDAGDLRLFGNNGDGTFAERVGTANPFAGITVTGRSKPAFTDLDGDGDQDLVLGQYNGPLAAYANNGAGGFTLMSAAQNPLSALATSFYSTPTFVDIDSDGDIDAVVGDAYGSTRVFLNNGAYVYAYTNGTNYPFDGNGLDYNTAPAFTDLDGDGDQDLVLGGSSGQLYVYANDGAGRFFEMGAADNPLNGLDFGNSSTPSFVDLDGDGDRDLVIGSLSLPLAAMSFDGNGIGVVVNVTPQNDAPAVSGLPARPKMVEDGYRYIDTQSIVVADADGTDQISLTFTASEGKIWAHGFAPLDVSSVGAGTGVVTLNGTAAALTEYLAKPNMMYYRGAQDDAGVGAAYVTVLVNDGAGSGNLSGGYFYLDIEPREDPMVLNGVPASVAFDETTVNGAPQLLYGDVSLYDPEGFNYGMLRVSGILAEERVSVVNIGTGPGQIGIVGNEISYGGAVIGTLSGGGGDTLAISFGFGATGAAVEALIESLTYTNTSDTPTETRTLRLDLREAPTVISGVLAGNVSRPGFTDLDGDGDLDVVIGSNTSGLRSYRNDGIEGFTELTGSANPFSAILGSIYSTPTLVDYDGDGDEDIVLGTQHGTLYTYRNDGGGVYTWLRDDADPFRYVNNADGFSAPAFVDLDLDGDLDVVLGHRTGTLLAYDNDGAGTYDLLLGTANPLNAVGGIFYSTPTFADVDGDGDLDAVVGGEDGHLRTYLRDDAGGFAAATGANNPFDGYNTGSHSAPIFADIDGDGRVELLTGSGAGYLRSTAFDPAGFFTEVTVTPQNDAPIADGLPPNVTATEDVFAAISLRGLHLRDQDGPGDLTVRIVASSGILNGSVSYAASLGITLTGQLTPELTLTGPIGALNRFFYEQGPVAYLSARNVEGAGAATLAVFATDGVAADAQIAAIDINITPVNDTPYLIDLPANATFAEDTLSAAPQLLFGDARLSDVEGFDGGVLRVSGLLAEDVVSVADGGTGAGAIGLSGGDVTYGGAVIGTLSGGQGDTLTIAFGTGATPLAVQALVRSITYANAADAPTALRHLTVALEDGDGGAVAALSPRTGSANPFNGKDYTDYSAPTFTDFDGDGDLDVVIGAFDGRMRLLDNNGSGALTLLSGANSPIYNIDVGGLAAPVFADIDGDDDLDLVVGALDGLLRVYANDGASGYGELTGAATPFAGAPTLVGAAPAFADLDGDGDVDAVIGDRDGALITMWNDGAGHFAQSAANPFAAIAVGAYSKPVFVDLDQDGDLDLVIGAHDGKIRAVLNDGAGAYTQLTGVSDPFAAIDIGTYSSPGFADLNGDGRLEMYVGERNGTLTAYTLDTWLTVAVSVIPDNDAPIARDDALTTDEDTAIAGSLLDDTGAGADSDPDGDVLTIAAVNGVAGAVGGQITLASGALLTVQVDGSYVYDPNGAFDGLMPGVTSADAFEYAVVDAAGGHAAATATVIITGINHAPTPRDDALAGLANAGISGSVLADNGAGADSDGEGDAMLVATVNGDAGAVGGAITLASGARLTLRADGTFDYDTNGTFDTLPEGLTTTDSFTYGLSDGLLGSVSDATVTIAITGVNDAPDARLDMFAALAHGILTGSVLADNQFGADGDVDGDGLSVVRVNNAAAVGQAVTLASGAQLTLNADGSFAYEPMGAFAWLRGGEMGADSFAYTITDGTLRDSAVVALMVAGVDDAPDFTGPAVFEVASGDIQVGAITATDPEGDAITYAIAGGADADLFDIDAGTGALSFRAPSVGGAYDVVVSASDGAGVSSQAVAVTVPIHGAAIGEVVQLTVGTDWQMIDFANTYDDAVVFALAPSLNEAESVATRFRNIDATGGEIKLQETRLVIDPATGLPGPNTSGHVDEAVTLLVLERGKHTLEDGTVIRVGEVNTSKLYVKGFETIAFSTDFTSTPSIFSQVQTYNGTDFIISRQRNPDTDGFQLTMQEEQADNLNHATETVGWLAVEHGTGTLSTMDYQVGSSAQNVNGKLTNVAFNAALDAAPLVVASLASYNGTDTSSPRIGTVGADGFTAMALEDQSYDLETLHGYEIVDWLAFSNAGIIYEAGDIAPPPAVVVAEENATLVARTGTTSATHEALTIDFGGNFVNPVVIATLTSANDTEAAIARVSNVTATGFDVAVQETGDQDGVHGAEDISWIVVEEGSWVLPDGTALRAGLEDVGSTTRQGFAAVDFDASFTADPVVLTQTQTVTDAAFVKTRMQDVDAAGFSVALEEEEAASWGNHGTETVGWIAVDMGLASDADGFVFEAGETSGNHNWKAEAFTDAIDQIPGLVAGMATFTASDTASTRIKALIDTGFEIHVEEDTSLNLETRHGIETFHWIAFNGEGELWGDALV